MAAVMAAGMVPPLAMALASAVRPACSPSPSARTAAAWLLGASFISEGAIPFAAADPLRVIPSMMAVCGDRCVDHAFDVTSRRHTAASSCSSPSGIWRVPRCLAAGTAVGAVAVVAAKQFAKPKTDSETSTALVAA